MSLTYSAAVEQTITAGEQIHQIVNGTATTEVIVEDGSKVPSIRKALLDNFYFKDPIAWQVGQTENVFNQLRQFTDGSWWYAPSATASNPISMGSTPVGDSLWKIYDFDAIGKLTPQIRESLRRSYAEAGYNVVGDFATGCTVTERNQGVLYETDGTVYVWLGALPKVVTAASSPATTGGVGSTGWLDVGDASVYARIISELSASTGAEMVGTPYGDLYDYFAAKDFTFPIKNIYPTMSLSEINALLATKGSFHFNAGNYVVPASILPSENSTISFHPGSLLKPSADGVTIINMTNATPGTAYLRNCHLYNPRITLDGKNNCQAIRAYKTRNHSSISLPWIDMTLGSNNVGIRVEFLSYGLNIEGPEVLNGGAGSTRIMVRNGSNAVVINNPKLYSGDPSGVKPDYGIVVFNGLNGDYTVDNVNTFVTASVNVIGGFSQDTNLFGLYDQSVSCNVQGTYFENNLSSDVALRTGSYYFNSDNTHHSRDVGGSCFSGRGANYARIGNFNPVQRSVGAFDFTAGNNRCVAELSTYTPGMVIGTTDGLRVSLGKGSVRQYTPEELPININQGFETYQINVTSGLNVSISGTQYNGQRIRCIFRGNNIESLTFAGIPVDVTGANTATTKTAIVEATYWSAIAKWTLTMPQWSA